MRWSEFSQKQCVDLMNGEKLGSFCDLKLDPYTGTIESVSVPLRQSWLKRNAYDFEVRWSMVQKVGSEMVIVDSNVRRESAKSF